MEHHVGIDFGTTNSAVAIAGPGLRDGVRLAAHWRTVLYFDPGGEVFAGPAAIEAYLGADGEGRLVQSMKSHLTARSFRTTGGGRAWSIEDLVAEYLRQLRRAVDVDLGRRAVVGRPVRYWGSESADDDARALGRMRAALAAAGFDEVVFEYEPIGAAARYAARLAHEELVLVADFGGGTSDFSLLRVGGGRAGEILATGGVAIGGDSFDARVIDALVAPALGRGTAFVAEMGADTPVPVWLFHRLRRWHHLSFLKDAETTRLLDRIERGAREPARIARLVRLIRDDLGLPLHQAVERAKIALSTGDRALLDVAPLGIAASTTRASFEDGIAPELGSIAAVIDRVLADAGVDTSAVDRVFATGGSSLVPAVRGLLGDRFGADRVVGGEELTAVCWGLAAGAAALLR